MNFIEYTLCMEAVNKYYVDVITKQYADFDGKTKRRPFWMFVLFNFIVSFLLGVVEGMLFGEDSSLLTSIYSLALLLPSVGIGIRRLHDIGKSGWYLLLGLIPVIGWLILIYFYVQPSKK